MKYIKHRNFYYLIIIFFSATLMFPGIAYDPSEIEFKVLQKRHRWLNRETHLLIYTASKKYNVPSTLICGLIAEESSGNPKAVSVANARGLCQIIGKYHYKGCAQDLFQEDINIFLGVKIFSEYLRMAKGDKRLALRYYNAGPHAPSYNNWGYVNRIIQHFKWATPLIDSKIIIVE